MKKLFALLLAVVMVMSMATVAFAEEIKVKEDEKGSITINKVVEGNVYEIYKLLDLESYDKTTGAYSYKINARWTGFFATEDALKYMAIDEAGYVTWIAAEDDDTVAAFAKLALAYAKANDIGPVASSKNADQFTTFQETVTNSEGIESVIDCGKFSDLTLGYYLVDSTVGALCGLTTTNPDASINAKNGTPTIDKQVKEDSTNQFGSSNTADIGQTVEFRTTINVHAGAENYILHDKMSAGLTFNPDSVSLQHIVPGTTAEPTTVPAEYYEVVTEGLTDDCTFEIRFTQAFCDHLETNDKVIVYYSAMLNRNAVIAGDGNTNETHLEFGDEMKPHYTTPDTTTTYSFGIDIVKTDSQNTLIDGAEFRIYDAATGGNEVKVVLMDDGVTYRRARADEKGVAIVVKNGQVRVVGFDNGTYYLEETVAPAGYNKLTARQKFIISDKNLDAVYNNGTFSTGSGVHVVNKTGSMLPETGAEGTVAFITFGFVVMMATGVLLVTRKRMSMIED